MRKNINCFTDVIWERRKELKLCSHRPLEWAVDSYPEIKIQKEIDLGLGCPGGAVVKSLPANAGDTGLSPGLGRSHMPWSN